MNKRGQRKRMRLGAGVVVQIVSSLDLWKLADWNNGFKVRPSSGDTGLTVRGTFWKGRGRRVYFDTTLQLDQDRGWEPTHASVRHGKDLPFADFHFKKGRLTSSITHGELFAPIAQILCEPQAA